MNTTNGTIASASAGNRVPRIAPRRLWGGLGALGVLCAGAVLVWLERPATAETPPPNYIMITNAVSNLCLGISGNNTRRYYDSDFDPLDTQLKAEVNYCNPGNGDRGEDNQWELVPLADGHMKIKNRTGLCLTLRRESDPEAAKVSVMADNCYAPLATRNSRQWRVVTKADGFKQLVNRRNGLCLSVVGTDEHKPGYRVEVNSCSPDSKDPARDTLWLF